MTIEEKTKIIEQYLNTDIDNLLVTAGRILAVYKEDKDVSIASSETRKSAIERTKVFLEEKKMELQQKLCVEMKIIERIETNQYTSNIELITVIADAIANSAVMFPPFTLAVILFKKGLHNLCNE